MRRAGAALLALACALPLGAVAGTDTAPRTAPAGPVAVADSVGDQSGNQSCDQPGGFAIAEWPTALSEYDAGRVWAHATGAGVRVAVVDSGINVANPHFVNGGRYGNAYAEGTSFLPAALGEAYVNVYDPRGWADPSGHGTAVAGIIAARPVEGSRTQVIGLAPESTVIPVQVFGAVVDERGDAAQMLPDTGRLAEGIRWAADAGAQVISVSMSVKEADPRLEAAVAHAIDRGALVVASAGSALTASPGDDGGVHYPAGFPGVLGVTAVDTAGQPSSYSFTGAHVDVAAPGQLVATAYRGLLDCYLGTEPAPSYAVPYVAATAALLAERYPDEGAEMWAHRIMMSAQRPAQGARDDVVGWGLLSPYDALTMTVDPSRPGPAVPGHDPVQPPDDAAAATVAQPPTDAWAPARSTGMVLAGGGAGLVVALAFVRALARGRTDQDATSRAPRPATRGRS